MQRNKKPFKGAYNRCYIDKNGEYKEMYTDDCSFGTSNRIPEVHVFILLLLAIPTIVVLITLISSIVNGESGEAEVRLAVAMLAIISYFLSLIIPDIKANKEAYNYFKEHPDKLTNNKMSVRDICPECGTQNNDYVNCINCGKDLTL